MFSWWYGGEKSRAEPEQDSSHGEAPETPAPIFAARAFRTAIFGTPAPPVEPNTGCEKKPATLKTDRVSSQSQILNLEKPSGILVTPGTALSRRKTVTFGSDIVENDDRISKTALSCGLSQECPGKIQSNSISESIFYDQPTRTTPLTREMEKAREAKPGKHTEEQHSSTLSKSYSAQKPLATSDKYPDNYQNTTSEQKDGKNLWEHTFPSEDDRYEEDITFDLNQPCSQSGKHWKSQYETYLKDARSEMKKLLSQREAARLYATEIQAKAETLAGELEKERQKLSLKDEEISSLRAKIASTGDERCENQSLAFMQGQTSPSDMEIKIMDLKKQLEGMVTFKIECNKLRDLLFEKDEIIKSLKAEKKTMTQRIFSLNSRLEKDDERCFPPQKEQRTKSVIENPQLDNAEFRNPALLRKLSIEQKMGSNPESSSQSPRKTRIPKSPDTNIKDLIPAKTLERDSKADDYQNKTYTSPQSRQQESQESLIPSLHHTVSPSSPCSPPANSSPLSYPRTRQHEPTKAANRVGIDSIPSPYYGPVQHMPFVKNHKTNSDLSNPRKLRLYSSNYDSSSSQHTQLKSDSKFETSHDHNYRLSSIPRVITSTTSAPKLDTGNLNDKDVEGLGAGSTAGSYQKRISRSSIPAERFRAASERLAERKRLALEAARSGRGKQSDEAQLKMSQVLERSNEGKQQL